MESQAWSLRGTLAMAGDKRSFPGFPDAATPSLSRCARVGGGLDVSYPVNTPLHGYSTGLFDGLNDRDGSYPRFGNAPYIDSWEFLALQQEVVAQRNVMDCQGALIQEWSQAVQGVALQMECKFAEFHKLIGNIEMANQVLKQKTGPSNKVEHTPKFSVSVCFGLIEVKFSTRVLAEAFVQETMIHLVGLATEPDNTDAEEASNKLPHPLTAGTVPCTRANGSTIYNPNWHRDINDKVNKVYITAVVKLWTTTKNSS